MALPASQPESANAAGRERITDCRREKENMYKKKKYYIRLIILLIV